jgi:phosphate transport system protein
MSASSNSHSGEIAHVVELTSQAFDLARTAAGAAARSLASGSADDLKLIHSNELKLDAIDHDVDELVTALITRVNETQARELLACMKLVVALERVGDLLLGFGNRVESVGPSVDPEDQKVLVSMATQLEAMLGDAERAFTERNLDHAIATLRADAELDRLRNLTVFHHIESPHEERRPTSFHILFMAQGLERAGDHVKNIAEEVCHLVSGRTVRHVLRSYDRPDEQRFIDHLKAQHRDKP